MGFAFCTFLQLKILKILFQKLIQIDVFLDFLVFYPNPAAGNGHIPQAGPLGVGGLPPAPQNHVSPVYTFMGSPSSFMVVHPGGAGVKFYFFFWAKSLNLFLFVVLACH